MVPAMARAVMARGMDAELAEHWRQQLEDQGIDAELSDDADGVTVSVDAERLAEAQALFADPFADELAGEEEAAPPAEAVRPLDPDERTVVLARTGDLFAAQRLAGLLADQGLYVAVDSSVTSNAFGLDGPTVAILTISEREQERAFTVLEALAREHTTVFEGAQRIDPEEVVAVLLEAARRMVRVVR